MLNNIREKLHARNKNFPNFPIHESDVNVDMVEKRHRKKPESIVRS